MKKILKDVHISILLSIISILLFLSFTVQADEIDVMPKVLFEMVDPVGDDWGPGYYTYPQYKQFEPHKGLFDITYFSIVEDGSDYTLEFVFDEVRNPWNSKYNFSHPLIELYFDNKSGGSGQLFRPGAKVKFDQKAPWDVMLHITGWWVKVFRPEDREEAERSIWSDPEDPFDLEAAVVTLEDKTIRIEIEKSVLGDLSDAKFYLLVGAFDSFGPNYYRDVGETGDDWIFGGAVSSFSPRVIDMLVPAGQTQEEVLNVEADADEFATIPYLRISMDAEAPLIIDRLFIWFGIFVVGLVLLIIVRAKSKKDSIDT